MTACGYIRKAARDWRGLMLGAALLALAILA